MILKYRDSATFKITDIVPSVGNEIRKMPKCVSEPEDHSKKRYKTFLYYVEGSTFIAFFKQNRQFPLFLFGLNHFAFILFFAL